METNVSSRVDRLEGSVSALSVDVAGVKVQLSGLGAGQTAIMDKLDAFDRARPGVSSILPWLGGALGIIGLLGGALASPQLSRISTIEQLSRERQPRIEETRAQVAILCHDAPKGCSH